ncbi:phage holin family protein [Paenibacillus peoriae]|uniref:phage holin family protein n=1 Tax=Paenibacillus peoriae TaxID=59893 RepID=UPI001F51C3F7|nr:phage holin family protein [Paenibacillus peoriae]MEC0183569.1 phage holin family protein [Paenibacillus peoriae]
MLQELKIRKWTATIYFYADREGSSLAENLDAMDVPLPFRLEQFLHQLNEKGDGKAADTGASKEKI